MNRLLSRVDLLPLTHPQQRISLVEQMYPQTPIHVVGCTCIIHGPVDMALLTVAIRKYVSATEACGLRFVETEGEIKQYRTTESDNRSFPIPIYDFSAQDDSDAAFQDWVELQSQEPMQIGQAAPYRFALFKINDSKTGFLYKFHHIIADGWSVHLMTDEICELYMSMESGGEPSELDRREGYLGMLQQERSYEASDRFQKDKQFWNELFAELPAYRLPDEEGQLAGKRASFRLGGKATAAIKHLAAKLQCSDQTVLTSMLLLYMYRSGKQDDLVIGMPVFNRTGVQQKRVFGLFTSMMPFRMQVDQNDSVTAFITKVKRTLRKCYSHQKYPYDVLVRDLELRKREYGSLFQVTVNCFNTKPRAELNGWRLEHREFYNGHQLYPLQFIVSDWSEPSDYTLDIQYKTSLYTQEQIEVMGAAIQQILEQMLSRPDAPVNTLELLSLEQREQQLVSFNETKVSYSEHKTVTTLLEEQVERTPERPALTCGGRSLTYSQLNEESNRLASGLRERGIGPNDLVAIIADRSLELIAGIYGILKAGAAYVPIDPAYPKERIAYIIRNSQASLVLIQPQLREAGILEGDQLEWLELLDIHTGSQVQESIPSLQPQQPVWSNPVPVNIPADLAYVIYTSGSTGNPKGVMIEHRSVVNFIEGIAAAIPMDKLSTMLGVTTVSFDIFVLETLLPLSRGMEIILASEEEQVDSSLLHELIESSEVDIVQMTPSRMRLLLEGANTSSFLSSVAFILLGGEPLPLRLLEQLRTHTTARIFNMYGPTEATVWSTLAEVTNSNSITVGKPIANTSVYILDDHNELLPIGASGQLCIGGTGLARGYLHRPNLTADKFVEHPFHAGERLYLTGDLARWLPDGTLVHMGRMDDQVKIRGYRIELGEVENVLQRIDGIRAVAVVDREDKEGIRFLHACYETTRRIEPAELRAYMEQLLPSYMIPSSFTAMAALPISPNGKLDRKALLAALSVEGEKSIQAASSKPEQQLAAHNDAFDSLERTIAACWSQVLTGQIVGRDAHFFESGGHSLHVLRTVSAMKERDIPVKASDLYAAPTIAGLAARLREQHGAFAFQALYEEQAPISAVSRIQVNTAIVPNRDSYSWEAVNCFIKPMAILFESFHAGYFDLFLFLVNYEMTFFPGGWKEDLFERASEPNRDFFEMYDKRLKSRFHIDIEKIACSSVSEFQQLLHHELDRGARLLVPGDLFGVYYSNHYLSEPHIHYFVIKGYDAKRGLLFILDNMHMDEGARPIYKDFTVRVEDLFAMLRYYVQHWCPDGTSPFFWTLTQFQPVSMTSLQVLEEHCRQLEQWQQGSLSMQFLEEEMVKEIKLQGHATTIAKVIPLTNYKFVYYDLLYAFMEEAGASADDIEQLSVLSGTIGEAWEQFRLALFDLISDKQFALDELGSSLTNNLARERQFFKLLRSALSSISFTLEGQAARGTSGKGLLTAYNPNKTMIVHEEESIQIRHSEERIDDIWIVKDEAPQLLMSVDNPYFSFEAKVTNHNKFGPCYHSGLIIKFNDRSKIMFGNARRKLLGIFFPEHTDNYELYARPDVRETHYLKIEAAGHKLTFYAKTAEAECWEQLYELERQEIPVQIGLFSKTWEPTEHRTEFSQVNYLKHEVEE